VKKNRLWARAPWEAGQVGASAALVSSQRKSLVSRVVRFRRLRFVSRASSVRAGHGGERKVCGAGVVRVHEQRQSAAWRRRGEGPRNRGAAAHAAQVPARQPRTPRQQTPSLRHHQQRTRRPGHQRDAALRESQINRAKYRMN